MKYELAKMQIVTFISEENRGQYYNGKPDIFYGKTSNYGTRTCLVDHKNKKAYNIYTLEEEFPVLEKDEKGLILPNQNVELNIRYAMKQTSLKKNFQNQVEYLFRKHLLKKVLKRKKLIKK